MKKYLLFILLSTTAFALNSRSTVKKIKTIEGLYAADSLVINGGFEFGISNWTASGGTHTITSTAANVGRGSNAGSWDSDSASQTFSSDSQNIPAGLYGKNAVLSCLVKAASGTATHTMNVHDGTNIVASTTITSSTSQFIRQTLNFPMPSTGGVFVRFISVASNEPTIYIDDCTISDAVMLNVSQVNQASLVGSAYTPTTAGCDIASSSSSLAAFPDDTDCPGATVESNPGPGVIQTTDNNNPTKFTVNNLPPGTYKITYTMKVDSNAAAGIIAFSISDGTSQSGQISDNTALSGQHSATLVGVFTYTSAKSSVTYQVFGAAVATATVVNIYNSQQLQQTRFTIERFPTSGELAYKPDMDNLFGYARATGAANCIWDFNGGAYASASNDADCNSWTFTGEMAAASNAKTPGFTLNSTIPPGSYKITFAGTGLSEASNTCEWRIYDGTTQIVSFESSSDAGGASGRFSNITGIVTYTSPQTGLTFNLQGFRASGSNNCRFANADTNQAAQMMFEPIKLSINAPLLVGSVTSGNAGALRFEAAELNCDASSAVTSQTYASFVSAVGNRSSTSCSVTFAAGTWTSAPYCTFSTKAAANSSGVTVTSTTAATIYGPSADYDGYLNCIGSR